MNQNMLKLSRDLIKKIKMTFLVQFNSYFKKFHFGCYEQPSLPGSAYIEFLCNLQAPDKEELKIYILKATNKLKLAVS